MITFRSINSITALFGLFFFSHNANAAGNEFLTAPPVLLKAKAMIYCGDIGHVRSIDIIDHLGDTNRFRDSTPKYPSASDVFSDVKKEITKEYKDFTKTIKKQSQLKSAKDYYISLLSGIKTLESFDSYEITSHCNIKQSVEDSVFGKINDKESALEAELN